MCLREGDGDEAVGGQGPDRGPGLGPVSFPAQPLRELDLGVSGGLSSSDTTLVLLDQTHPEPLWAGRGQSR